MTLQHRLTTIDNPFDPFDHYDQWLAYDEQHGHFTSQLLGRVDRNSDEMSEKDQNISIEQAINDIITVDPFGIYKKVSKEVVIRTV